MYLSLGTGTGVVRVPIAHLAEVRVLEAYRRLAYETKFHSYLNVRFRTVFMGFGFTVNKTPLFVGSCRLLSVLLRPPSFLAITAASSFTFLGLRPCGQSTMELAAAIFVDDLDLTWRPLARFGITATASKRPWVTISTWVITGVHKSSVQYGIFLHEKPRMLSN